MCPRGHEHAPSRFEHTSAFCQPGVLVGHVLTRFHRPGKSRPACQQKMRIHRQRGGEKKREREGKREREREMCVRARTHAHIHTRGRAGTHTGISKMRAKGVCTVVIDHRRSKVLSSKGRFKASATRKSVVSFKSACALRAVAWAHCTGLSVTPVTLAPAQKKRVS